MDMNKITVRLNFFAEIHLSHDGRTGHFDLLVGRNAKAEVWAQVIKFLEDTDSVG